MKKVAPLGFSIHTVNDYHARHDASLARTLCCFLRDKVIKGNI
jgi:hypothetical protein